MGCGRHFAWGAVAVVALLPLLARAQAGAPTTMSPAVARVGSGVGPAAPVAATQTAQAAPQGGTPPAATPSTVLANKPASVPAPAAARPPVPEPMPAPGMPAPANLVNEALDQAAPLTPEELRRLRKELDERQRALTENVSGRPPAKPTSQIYNIDLSPGATPPVVSIERGHGAIVSFLDASGKPWPARVSDNFNPEVITVSQFTEHQLSIGTARSTPVNVGVAVALEGLPVAITFTVISGQPWVDSQVRMVIPQYRGGAPAGAGLLKGDPALAAGDLMAFLLRTPPASARSLTVDGLPGALAWQISPSRMVLRTNYLVITGYFRSQGLGDGTSVYELPLSPVVRVADNGQFRPVRIAGFISGGK